MIGAIAAAELRTRRRRLRFSLGVGLCVALGLAAGLTELFLEPEATQVRTASLVLAGLLDTMPFLGVLMAILIAGEGTDPRTREEERAILLTAPVSNAGVQIRRGIVLCGMTLFASLLPFVLGAVVVVALGVPGLEPSDWLLAWLTTVAPRVVTVVLAWLGLVTIFRSEIGALVAFVMIQGLGTSAVNLLLQSRGYAYFGPQSFFGWRILTSWFRYVGARVGHLIEDGWVPEYPATSAPWDPRAALEEVMVAAEPYVALALAVWLVSAVFLGRTRRNVRPRPVRAGHPVPTIAEAWNRMRQERSPDAGTTPSDRLALTLALALAVGSVGWVAHEHRYWRHVAEQRYEIERSGAPEPHPLAIVAETWEVEGHLGRRGMVEVAHRTRVRNETEEPLDRLIGDLRPGLAIRRVVDGEDRRLTVDRRYDRLEIPLNPPVPPGESISLEMVIEGVPQTHRLRMWGMRTSFVTAWETYLGAQMSSGLSDLSETTRTRRIGLRGASLEAVDLAPRLRYTTYELTPPPQSPGERGRYVRDETTGPLLNLSVELEHPQGWVLADSCGSISEGTTFEGACRAGLADWSLRAGPRVRVEESEIPMFVLPVHRVVAERQARDLGRVRRMAEEAWPGAGGFEGVVFWEQTPNFSLDLRTGMNSRWRRALDAVDEAGRLIFLAEWRLDQLEPIAVDEVVGDVLSSRLLERREVPDDEVHLVRGVLDALMKRSMGSKGARTAVSYVRLIQREHYRRPVTEASVWTYMTLLERLPALVADLEGRIGREVLRAGVESYLSGTGGTGGTGGTEGTGGLRDLFLAIQRESGRDLSLFWEEFLDGNALPILAFEDLEVEREGANWFVSGRLANSGDGHVECPVVVETASGEKVEILSVEGEAGASFRIDVPERPELLILDPRETCHRWVTKGLKLAERQDLLQASEDV